MLNVPKLVISCKLPLCIIMAYDSTYQWLPRLHYCGLACMSKYFAVYMLKNRLHTHTVTTYTTAIVFELFMLSVPKLVISCKLPLCIIMAYDSMPYVGMTLK